MGTRTGLLHDELALLDDHLFRLTGSEERGLAEPLRPQRLLDAVALEIDGEEELVDVLHQERGLAVLGGEHEGVEADLFIVAIADDLEDPVAVEVGQLDRDGPAEEAHGLRPLRLHALLDDLVHVDLIAVADHHARDPIRLAPPPRPWPEPES